jgi:hypothetical protein
LPALFSADAHTLRATGASKQRSTASSGATRSASKKTLHAAEQDRPDVAEARKSFKAGQAGLNPRKLIFVDETGTSTKMVRIRGRCRKGKRPIGKAPFGHWKTTTFTAGLRVDGLVAPFVLDGPMNGESFLVYVEQVRAPPLRVCPSEQSVDFRG